MASDYFENLILNWLRGAQLPTPPTNLYIALFTIAPTDAGGGTEVAGGGYARTAVALSAPAGGGGLSANPSQVAFPVATGAWGTVIAVGLMDAASGGNMLDFVAIAGKTFGSGQRPVFDPNSFSVTAT